MGAARAPRHAARGLREEQLVDGARRATLEELTAWTLWADKTLTF